MKLCIYYIYIIIYYIHRLFEETSRASTRTCPCWRLLEHLCFHVQVYDSSVQVVFVSIGTFDICWFGCDSWWLVGEWYTMSLRCMIMRDLSWAWSQYIAISIGLWYSLMVFVAAAYRWYRSQFEFLHHAGIASDDWLQSKLLLVNIYILGFSRQI